ncbi:cytochrome c [Sphingomonas insulae]|uniref:Cytochrome c family protein n=1 Tax=Sphingomonas insulae TaxID=424800 RepID=A0ABN1HU06_9SPHN|nr:c-type cytochrome [Sphingomonas insulae]NIJ28198.1 cytochrome c [Sphingomonas insulae]
MIGTAARYRRHLAAVLTLLVAACSNDDTQARRDAAGPRPDLAAWLRIASPAAGARRFAICAQCHAIRAGAPDRNGPNLYGVMGGGVAQASPRFGYTAALRQVGGRWTPERMDAWLAAPRRFAPGTSMGFPGLADPLARADLIAYLQSRR